MPPVLMLIFLPTSTANGTSALSSTTSSTGVETTGLTMDAVAVDAAEYIVGRLGGQYLELFDDEAVLIDGGVGGGGVTLGLLNSLRTLWAYCLSASLINRAALLGGQ